MSQVVLILPGATDYELQGRIHGDLDIPLCDEGREEVQRVSRELQDLGIEVIYTSCCSSAVQTAETIGKALGVKVKKLENLKNLDHGLWQGLLIDEVKQKQPRVYRQWQDQPESVCPPEGETIDHARQRMESALAKVLKKHKDDIFGLVVPEPLASLVREYLGQSELGDLWRATCEHGRWGLIAVAGDAKGKPHGIPAAIAPPVVKAEQIATPVIDNNAYRGITTHVDR
ncbi:MAG: histidine phosphatase family protein [Planctomycetia bacterium]|nr:histidine phosphatase family protein [Planctomycetia bacterium]